MFRNLTVWSIGTKGDLPRCTIRTLNRVKYISNYPCIKASVLDASQSAETFAFVEKTVADVNVGICWSVGKNLFRLRYGQVWKFHGQRCG